MSENKRSRNDVFCCQSLIPTAPCVAALKMSQKQLNEFNEQTKKALETLHALQQDSDTGDANEVDASSKGLKLMSAEDSARNGMDDVFELPVEYEDENSGAEEELVPSKPDNNGPEDSSPVAVAVEEATKSSPSATPSKVAESSEADVLINRVGQRASGYQSRIHAINKRRRILAAIVVVLLGAAIATVVAWAVYRSGVVDGNYRLSKHPHGMSNKNHLKGSPPELHGNHGKGSGNSAGHHGHHSSDDSHHKKKNHEPSEKKEDHSGSMSSALESAAASSAEKKVESSDNKAGDSTASDKRTDAKDKARSIRRHLQLT